MSDISFGFTLFGLLLFGLIPLGLAFGIAQANSGFWNVAGTLIGPLIMSGFALFIIGKLPLYFFQQQIGVMVNSTVAAYFAIWILGAYLGNNIRWDRFGRNRNKARKFTPEAGATTPCIHCALIQHPTRLSTCNNCGGGYCDFPNWPWFLKSRYEDFILSPILILVYIGSAIMLFLSYGVGLLLCIPLAIALYLPVLLLPNFAPPDYWRNCGYDNLCKSCNQKLNPSEPYYGPIDEEDPYEEDRWPQEEDSSDEDKDDRSFWDPIIKW